MRSASSTAPGTRRRVTTAALAALTALAGALAWTTTGPAPAADAAECAAAFSPGTVYVGGDTVSYEGQNWTAKWWTVGTAPDAAQQWGVWSAQGECGGTTPTDPPTEPTDPPTEPGDFVVSKAQFEQMFPDRVAFYTYEGLVEALEAYPGFATTGGDEVAAREAAAFLANVDHESGGLKYIKEINEANYPHYCDETQPYGCPAGQAAYYGKGPIQLSWNFNYKAAGDALGIDLLNDPYLVETDPAVAWKTALWYWNTQSGPGTMTGHEAIVGGHGFGETIRSINGALECDGGNPAQVQSRVAAFQEFTRLLGTTPGDNLTC